MAKASMQAPKTTVYRIEPRESASCQAGDVSNFVCPEGVWDLSTFRLQFVATVNGKADSCSLPRNMASLIDTLTVYVDDIEVQSISHYNQLARILVDYDSKSANTDVLDNGEYITDTLASVHYNVSKTPCCVSSFHGLLGSGTVIRGALRVQVFWAADTVLLRDAATVGYTLDGMHAVIKMGDPELVTTRIVFDDWASTHQRNQSFNQQTHISVQSTHIEYVLATFLSADYDRLVSTTNTGGSSLYFAHGTTDPTADYGINVQFSADQVALSAGHIKYEFAPEHLADIFGGSRSIAYPTTLCRDGTVAVRTLDEVLAYQWCAGLPIGLKGLGRTVTLSFNTIGARVADNFSLLFVKTSSVMEVTDGGYALIR